MLEVIENRFVTCPMCGRRMLKKALRDNNMICSTCGHYYAMSGKDRIHSILDVGSFREMKIDSSEQDPLNFPGYKQKIELQQKKTGLSEAVLAGQGRIYGKTVVVAVLDSQFFMGSMGSAVGEMITCAVERAEVLGCPLIIFSASGGARMQEGIYSLMQMAKTASSIEQFSDNGGLFISVLTNPTYGGVTASFASLGDVMLAEPGAMIGFAGPRVIQQTIRKELPDGFQTSEFLLEHGFIDCIVDRANMRNMLGRIIKMHQKCRKESWQ